MIKVDQQDTAPKHNGTASADTTAATPGLTNLPSNAPSSCCFFVLLLEHHLADPDTSR